MKKIIGLLFLFITFGTVYGQTIAPHINKKKTENVITLTPKKIVIIGLTDNLEARKTFEKKMKEKLVSHGIDAYRSTEVSSMVFTEASKAEEELNELIEIITQKNFDSFMITTVTGVEEKMDAVKGQLESYKIYHLETDIYIFEEKEIVLLWGMCLDIYDYQLVQLKIEDYVNAIVLQMQYESILPKKEETEQLRVSN